MPRSLDWEIRRATGGLRAELFRGGDPTLLAVVEARSRLALYLRMTVAQWRHR